jgi:AhpD family alkylhydroperoxidase
MELRIDHQERQRAAGALSGLGRYLAKSSVEKGLLNLIHFRVSQINGCAFCLDMHAKDLRAEGETEQRLYVLDAWRETPFYTDRERAALAWAESLTKINSSLVPEEIYAEATKQFSEAELVDLTIAVIQINSYNRLNIAFGAEVGTYQVGQFN